MSQRILALRLPAPPSSEPDVAHPGERRQLTVLFCNPVGSAALAQQLDAEDWHDLLAQHPAAIAATVARWGGESHPPESNRRPTDYETFQVDFG